MMDLAAARLAVERLRKELRDVKLRLVQAAKAESLERLASGVAHEVRNPLATLQLGVEFFSRRPGSTADEEKILRTMQAAIDRTNRIVVELVELSRDKELDFRLENLNMVVRRALQSVEPDLHASSLQVDLDLPEGLPLVRLDPLKMELVLVHLLANAIEASPRCGRIRVTTRREQGRNGAAGASPLVLDPAGDFCCVEVRDEGSGIPQQHLGKIFDPFYTTKPKGSSTGLGLFAARTVVALHEGAITVENAEPLGVVARVLLPVA